MIYLGAYDKLIILASLREKNTKEAEELYKMIKESKDILLK